MKTAIDSLPQSVTSSKTANKNESQEADVQNSDVLLSRSNKGGAGLQEQLRKLKLMLPIAASNLFTFYFSWFCYGWRNAFETTFSNVGTKWVGSIDERLIKSNQEIPVYFQMPDAWHWDISLTIHVFSDFICNCIGNVSGCSILYSQRL